MTANIWEKTFTPKTQIVLENQRTSEKQSFNNDEIQLQAENTPRNGFLPVRGKYPNDAYFGVINLEELVEV